MSGEKDWIDVIGALGPLFGSLMIANMAFAQWRTFEKDRQAKQFQYYISNYRKIEKALDLVKSGDYSRALQYLHRAQDEAHIYFSNEICDFVGHLLSEIKKRRKSVFCIFRK